MKKVLILFILILNMVIIYPEFTIARVKYKGGGDWYTDPTALKNWLIYLKNDLDIETTQKEKIIRLTEKSFMKYPFLFISGHGNIKLNRIERKNLKKYLLNGGFLYANDDYGFDKAFRREINKIFPDTKFVKLPFEHDIFHCFYDMKYFPKVHKHDGKPPQLYALIKNNRIVILYTHEADIVDGITDYEVFKDKKEDREQARKFVVNMVFYLLFYN